MKFIILAFYSSDTSATTKALDNKESVNTLVAASAAIRP
jgi:hypothetical protein